MSNALALRKRYLLAYLLNFPGGKQTTAHCSWLRHGDGQWAVAIIWISSWASRVERVTAATRASCIRLRLHWWLQRLRSRPGPGSLREEAEVTSVIISVYRFVTFLYSRDSVLVSLKLTYHLYPRLSSYDLSWEVNCLPGWLLSTEGAANKTESRFLTNSTQLHNKVHSTRKEMHLTWPLCRQLTSSPFKLLVCLSLF